MRRFLWCVGLGMVRIARPTSLSIWHRRHSQCRPSRNEHPNHNFYFASSPENFVNIFFVFAWEFCIEKWRGFLVNFFWSPFPTKRSTKTPQKFGENSERNSGRNPGQKFEKFGELSFCDFSDLNNFHKDCASPDIERHGNLSPHHRPKIAGFSSVRGFLIASEKKRFSHPEYPRAPPPSQVSPLLTSQ